MDWNRKIIDWMVVVSFILLLLAPFFIFNSITGNVVLNKTKDEIKSDLYSFVTELPITKLAALDSKMCIIIQIDNETAYTFGVRKNADGLAISEPFSWDCNGENSEDFIIKYLSIEDFYEQVNEPTCERFKTTGAGEDFYYLPSRFVITGGDPVCNDEFNNKYCVGINYCSSNDEMVLGKLDCCLENRLSDLQKTMLANARNEIFPTIEELMQLKDEFALKTPEQEKPAATGSSIMTFVWIGLLAAALIVGAVSLTMLKSKHKEEAEEISLTDEQKKQLQDYIKNTMEQGFSEDQIKQALSQQGWPEKSIEEAFGTKNI